MKLNLTLRIILLVSLLFFLGRESMAQCTTYTAPGVTRCGSGSVTLSVTNGPPPSEDVTYQWYVGGSPISGATDPDYTVTVSSTTTYMVRIDDINCTSLQDINVTATVHALPTAPTMNNGSRCGAGDVTMSVQSPSSGTYHWYFNSAGTNPVPLNDDDYDFTGAGNSTMTANLNTTTSFWVKHTTGGGCSSALTQVTGTISSYPTVNAGSNITVCDNSGTYDLSSGGRSPSGGSWSSTNSTANSAITGEDININSLSPGTYTLTYSYTNPAGCNSTDNRTLTVNAATANPRVNGNKTTVTICPGETVELLIDGQPSGSDPVNGYSFEWFVNTSTQTSFDNATSITVTPGADITYYLEATNGTGCTSARQAITVDVLPIPANPSFADSDVERCDVGDITLQVTSPTTGTNRWYTNAAGTIEVTEGGGYLFSGAGNSSLTITNFSGYDEFWVKNVGANGCESAGLSKVTATANPLPAVNAGANLSACKNSGNLDLRDANPVQSGGTWSSTNSQVNNAISGNFIDINQLAVGNYTIDYTITDVNGCSNDDDIQLTVKDISATSTVNGTQTSVDICPGQTIDLIIDGQTKDQDPTGNYLFEWYSDAAAQNLIATATSITVSPSSNTPYYLVTTNGTLCPSAPQAITVNVLSQPVNPVVADVDKCLNEDVVLAVTSPSSGTNEWYTNAAGTIPVTEGGGYSFSGTGNSTLTIVGLTTTTDFWVKNTNGSGCESAGLTKVTATIHQPPAAPATPTISEACGSTDVIRASPTSGETWYWQTTATGKSTANSSGTYTMNADGTAYLRAQNDATSCWGPVTSLVVDIEENSAPIGFTAGSAVTVFAGSDFNLNNTGEYPLGGTWSGANVTNGNTFNASTAGPYTVTYTYNDGGLCNYQDTKTVTVEGVPALSAAGSTTLYRGATVDLVLPDVVNYSYQWYKDGSSITGATNHILQVNSMGDYHAVATNTDGATVGTSTTHVDEPLLSQNQNFVLTQLMRVESDDVGSITKERVSESYTYLDGLGRQVQSVQSNASPAGFDIVVPMEYDDYGRQVKQFLPYVSVGEYGLLQANALKENDYPNSDHHSYYSGTSSHSSSRAFTEGTFEQSPGGRMLTQAAPGESWQTKAIEYDYQYNDSAEVMQFSWSGLLTQDSVFYAANELTKNTVTDEDDKKTIEFTNKLGQTILKQSNVVDSTWAQTFYIYDDVGQLRAVLPPESVARMDTAFFGESQSVRQAFLNTWAFLYDYDGRRRMTMKKVPGADSVFMVYDKWDRLVLTQDGNQRSGDQWLFTKYDVLNRPVATGLMTASGDVYSDVVNHSTRSESFDSTLTATHQYTANAYPPDSLVSEYLTITYYDNYDFVPGSDLSGTSYVRPTELDTADAYHILPEYSAFVKGQVTGTKTKILGTTDFIESVSYYDSTYRVIQVVSENHQGGTDIISNQYDFIGNVRRIKSVHDGASQTNTLLEYAYDHANRLTDGYHTFNGGGQVHLFSNEYNELGELIRKKLHGSGSSFEQSIDYAYNIRGWLRSINESGLSGSGQAPQPDDLFSMELIYNTTLFNLPTN